jgi:hypothetical protein
MKALAQETGARSFFPTDIGQLGSVYDTITEELANEYAMASTSKNPRRRPFASDPVESVRQVNGVAGLGRRR